MRERLRMTGLPDSIVSENAGTPASGIARVIERQELIEQRDADKLSLKWFERDWARLLAIVANAGGWKGGPLPEEFEFNCDFAEERIYLEPDADYELARKRASNGDMDLVQYAREVLGIDETNPEKIAKIITERRELWEQAQGKNAQTTPALPGQPTGQLEVGTEQTEVIDNGNTESALVAETAAAER
jgi:hypothetical protein